MNEEKDKAPSEPLLDADDVERERLIQLAKARALNHLAETFHCLSEKLTADDPALSNATRRPVSTPQRALPTTTGVRISPIPAM